MTAMPTLARVYGLSPSDVWNLTRDEWDAFVSDMRGNSG